MERVDKVQGAFSPLELLRGTEGVGKPGTTIIEWKVFQLPQGLGPSSTISLRELLYKITLGSPNKNCALIRVKICCPIKPSFKETKFIFLSTSF